MKLNAGKKQATLDNGSVITYDRCLIATGGKPRNLPALQKAGSAVMDKVTLFRGIHDFKLVSDIIYRCMLLQFTSCGKDSVINKSC